MFVCCVVRSMADSFRSSSTSLVRVDTNLWTYDGFVSMVRIFRLPTRMTIIRLNQSNQLVVISPFPPTDLLKKLLAEIGEVRFIIIPNEHHTFWPLDFLRAYPNAYLLATRGVSSDDKLNRSIHGYFTNQGLLSKENIDWPMDEIDFYCFYNGKFLSEVVFYHRSTSTLILTDLAFNYFESEESTVRAEGYLFRFYLWLVNGYREASVSNPFRYFFRSNIVAIKNDFDEMMKRYEHFQRLIMAHGTIIEHRGYQALRNGTYQFVLDIYQNRNYSSINKKNFAILFTITATTAAAVCFFYL